MRIRGSFEITGLNDLIDSLYILDNALPNEIEMAAARIAEIAVGTAKEMCPVDTGALRNSIAYKITQHADELTVTVYTNMEYSEYVEFGTGTMGDPRVPHVQKSRWVYFDEDRQQFVMAYAQPPRPFMYPAFVAAKIIAPGMMADYLQKRIAELLGGGSDA